MKKITTTVLSGLFLMALGAQAGAISFSQLTAAGAGSVTDALGSNVTVTGYATVDPTDVTEPSGGPYVYTQTLTVSDIDLATGLAGGSDSFSFDLIYSAAGSKLDFRASAGVLLENSDPLTVTIGNFQVLSGSGTAGFSEWSSINTRNHNEVGTFIDIYEGTTTGGSLLLHAPDYNGSNFGTHSFSTSDSSITMTYDGTSAYLNGLTFDLATIPEPATLGLIAAFGSALLFIRRRLMM